MASRHFFDARMDDCAPRWSEYMVNAGRGRVEPTSRSWVGIDHLSSIPWQRAVRPTLGKQRRELLRAEYETTGT